MTPQSPKHQQAQVAFLVTWACCSSHHSAVRSIGIAPMVHRSSVSPNPIVRQLKLTP